LRGEGREKIDDGFVLKGGTGTGADTASEGWKRWAEGVEMKTIVERWAWTNMWRYVITGVAVGVSAGASIFRSR
jgi:hypothetical protein